MGQPAMSVFNMLKAEGQTTEAVVDYTHECESAREPRSNDARCRMRNPFNGDPINHDVLDTVDNIRKRQSFTP